jgi:hypothetical protein
LNKLFTIYVERMAQGFDEVDASPVKVFNMMIETSTKITKALIMDEKVQTLINSNNKFDLVISEVGMNEALFGENFFSTYN